MAQHEFQRGVKSVAKAQLRGDLHPTEAKAEHRPGYYPPDRGMPNELSLKPLPGCGAEDIEIIDSI